MLSFYIKFSLGIGLVGGSNRLDIEWLARGSLVYVKYVEAVQQILRKHFFSFYTELS